MTAEVIDSRTLEEKLRDQLQRIYDRLRREASR